MSKITPYSGISVKFPETLIECPMFLNTSTTGIPYEPIKRANTPAARGDR
jgi:hypothetical protein